LGPRLAALCARWLYSACLCWGARRKIRLIKAG